LPLANEKFRSQKFKKFRIITLAKLLNY